MASRKILTAVLGSALAAAALAPIVNCAAPEEEGAKSSESAYGENNSFGLKLLFNEQTNKIEASVPAPLAEGYSLRLRVRRGKIQKGVPGRDTEKELLAQCSSFADFAGKKKSGGLVGEVRYDGPAVSEEIKSLIGAYDRLYAAARARGDLIMPELSDAERAAGVDRFVEGCVLDAEGRAKAVIQTNLAYAWDLAKKGVRRASVRTSSLHILGGDAGGGDDGERLEEGTRRYSQMEYAELCVQELGEIPFFPKMADGKYETFDCRDLVANGEGGGGRHNVEGVEGAMIPVHVDGVEQKECTGRQLGMDDHEYACMKEADRGMFLDHGGVQPGPMVATAKNAEGTHWVLLCRKISDGSLDDPQAKPGMTKSKVFNDIAMLGHNPKTGRTCFFQNSINAARDGAHVPHPADKEKSTNLWSANHQAYCSESCHAADPFVHSPWIDGALRKNGTPIVPKMDELADFPISRPDRPYNIVNGGPQGHSIPKQITAPEVEACTGCHRLTVGSEAGNFTLWTTGAGDDYRSRLTRAGKEKFEWAYTMPPKGDMEARRIHTKAEFESSDFAKAVKFLQYCNTSNPTEEQKAKCWYADVPRGEYNQPPVGR